METHLNFLLLVVDHNQCLVLTSPLLVVSQVFILLVVLVHDILVTCESKSEIMSVSQMPRSLIAVMQFFFILVKCDHSRAKLCSFVYFSKLLERRVHEERRDLPEFLIDVLEVLILVNCMDVFVRMHDLVDPMQNFDLIVSQPAVIPMEELPFVVEYQLRLPHILPLIDPQSNLHCQALSSFVASVHPGYFDSLPINLISPLIKLLHKSIKYILRHTLQFRVLTSLSLHDANDSKVFITPEFVKISSILDDHIFYPHNRELLLVTLNKSSMQYSLLLSHKHLHGG